MFDHLFWKFLKLRLELYQNPEPFSLQGRYLFFICGKICFIQFPQLKNYAKHVKETWCLQWCFINALVIIIRMYTVSALFDITVPFLSLPPPPPMKIRSAALGYVKLCQSEIFS